MWSLLPLNNHEDTFHLLIGHQYTVGRRDCDIVVPNDMSISRRHAIITFIYVESDIADVLRIPKMKIKDVSKLGTLLRDERITNDDTERFINSGDVLEFGTAGISKYRCVYEPCVITTSCLDHSAKRVVKQKVLTLGGHMISEWTSDCTLVVMTSLSVTVKVICALVSLKHVVTPQFLIDMVSACETRTKLPDPNDYLPPLAESQVNPNEISFRPNLLRKSLFAGKRFYFVTADQFTKLRVVIQSAGGQVVLCNNDICPSDVELLSDSACIMWCDVLSESNSGRQSWIQHIQQLLAKNQKRMILESEIGFAVLYCSTTRYCNPSASIDMHDKDTNAGGVQPVPNLCDSVVSQKVSDYQHTMPSSEQVSRVEEAHQFPTAASHTRQNSSKHAANSLHQVNVANKVVSTDNISGSVTAPEKQFMNTGVLDNDEKECEYSASVKVDSSFVPDSLALDVIKSEDSDVDVLNQSGSDKRMEVNSGSAHTKRQLQIPEHQHQLQHMTQQSAGNADVPQHEQKSEPGTVAAVAPSSSKRASNVMLQQPSFTEAPAGVVMVEERNLVIQNYPTAEVSVSKHVTWQGQRVKNFKRFRKNSSFAVLPRCIIGGRDLVPHEALTLQQKEWFQNGLNTQSQSQNTDKLSQELFNWEPLKRRKH